MLSCTSGTTAETNWEDCSRDDCPRIGSASEFGQHEHDELQRGCL